MSSEAYPQQPQGPYQQYLNLGQSAQSLERLGDVLLAHRNTSNPGRQDPLSHAAVCIEIAQAAAQTPLATEMLNEASYQFEVLGSRDNDHVKGFDYVRRAAILESFMPRLRRELTEEDRAQPPLQDEYAVWLGMVGLLADGNLEELERDPNAGTVNAEAAMHALCARGNVLHREIRFQTFPAFPRQATYSQKRMGRLHHEWNMVVTEGLDRKNARSLLVYNADRSVKRRAYIVDTTLHTNLKQVTGVESQLELVQAMAAEAECGNPQPNQLINEAARRFAAFAFRAVRRQSITRHSAA